MHIPPTIHMHTYSIYMQSGSYNIALHYLHVRTCFLHVDAGTGPPVETDGGEREIGNVGGVALAPGW